MKTEKAELKFYKDSQYRLRTSIGILGILLPIILLCVHKEQLASISHYYYTKGSVFFTGILIAFGIILIAYKGYTKFEYEATILKDGLVTTLAGISVLIAVIIPTSSNDPLGKIFFPKNRDYLFGHELKYLSTIHLVSAGIFLFFLGYMCFSKFTLNPTKKHRNTFYKTCGIIVWVCICIIVSIKLTNSTLNTHYFEEAAYVFWLETIAVWSFGCAWLLKGKIDRSIKNFSSKIKEKILHK